MGNLSKRPIPPPPPLKKRLVPPPPPIVKRRIPPPPPKPKLVEVVKVEAPPPPVNIFKKKLDDRGALEKWLDEKDGINNEVITIFDGGPHLPGYQDGDLPF